MVPSALGDFEILASCQMGKSRRVPELVVVEVLITVETIILLIGPTEVGAGQ